MGMYTSKRKRWIATRFLVAGISLAALIGLGRMMVISIRKAQRQAACATNLKMIGLALYNYQSAFGTFPYAALPNPHVPSERRIGWQVSILQYLFCPHCMGFGDEYFKADYTRPWDDGPQLRLAARPVRDLLCPSTAYEPEKETFSRNGRAGEFQLTSNVPATYIGIAGIGKDAASLAAADPRAGFFGYNRTMDLAAIRDGLSTTMAVAETSDLASPWTSGGRATVRGLDPARQPYIGKGCQFGGCHPGGANVLFVDGSVRFLRDAIAPKVLEAVATVAGGEQLPPDWDR